MRGEEGVGERLENWMGGSWSSAYDSSRSGPGEGVRPEDRKGGRMKEVDVVMGTGKVGGDRGAAVCSVVSARLGRGWTGVFLENKILR